MTKENRELTAEEKLLNAVFGLTPDVTGEGQEQQLKGKLEDVLQTLTYREREIVKLRYGLGDGYAYTLDEVGRVFKVTRERVRQIEAKALRKLKAPQRAKELHRAALEIGLALLAAKIEPFTTEPDAPAHVDPRDN